LDGLKIEFFDKDKKKKQYGIKCVVFLINQKSEIYLHIDLVKLATLIFLFGKTPLGK
jgi:hypothetical protein